MLSARRLSILTAAVWLATAPACSSSSGHSEEPSPTLVTVSPYTFGQGVVCGDFPGAWKSYVATLTDVTDPSRPFILASSHPVPCSMPVSFSWVVPGHEYVAEIDGYEQRDLVSFGGESSGSRHVIDPATGLEMSPRWQTTCGKTTEHAEAETTMAYLQRNVVVGDCRPLSEIKPGTSPTSLVLDLSTVRGALVCGQQPGQVSRFRVSPDDPALSALDADCDEQLTFSPLDPKKRYRFHIEGFESEASSPTWGTWCEGRTEAGVSLPTACDPLVTQGALQVDMPQLLASSPYACSPEDIVSYRALLLGYSLASEKRNCSSPVVFPGLEPTTYQVLIDAFDSSGRERLNAFCEGQVQPGQIVDVHCQIKAAEGVE
ncbi:MAG TPA: hypothetical protein PLV85_05625 [Polyangiaceae bacterium]|nr:hypothetical protein [Polyangiaceae bacterium]